MQCPKCYYNNPKGANFCARCGIPLVQIKEGERRRVAILFADISGFSKLARLLDPEVVRDLIDNVFGELIGIIHKYEGVVDKIIGDCIMALFGVPKSQEDASFRSVMTALELQEKFKEIADRNKELSSANISIGINYGLVVTGSPGKASAHTVMGDAVVLAERLQSSAPPGEIYVSESVYQNTNMEVEYQIIDKLRLKGRKEPIKVYVPLSMRVRAPLRRLEEIPLIGREEEFAALSKTVKSVIQGKGEIISVIGEPGIGKSKLLIEFKREVARQYGTQVLVIEKRGIPYFKNSPYVVLREVINEIVEATEPRHLSFAVETCSYIKYFLSKELAYQEMEKIESMNPHDRKEAIEQSLLKVINCISRECPLIFILDDAHWVDEESLRFFASPSLRSGLRLRMGEEVRVLCIISYRPLEGVEEIVGKIGRRIILEGLKDQEILHLAKVKLDCRKLDPGLSGFLLYKSGGNPFYVEELINSLLEQQEITLQREIAICKGEIEIPDRISDLIISRIDRLDDEERELLEIASVIRDNFNIDILNKVAGKELRKSVFSLIEKGYLVETADSIYNFVHTLTREAIYGTLLMARRAKLHKKVAKVIEEFNRSQLDEFLEPLAHHYEEAGEIEKAIAYSERGGDHKRKLCLNEEAIKAYTSCVNLILKSYKERDRLLQLYEKLGETYESLGEYTNAIKASKEGAEYARKSTDKARMRRKAARVLLQEGDYERAYELLEEAEQLAEPGSNEWGWVRIHQAQLEVLKANLSQAEEIAAEVLEKTDLLAESLKVMAVVCDYQGKEKEAFLHRERAIKIVKRSGDEQKLRSGFELLSQLYSDYPPEANVSLAHRREQRRWLELIFDLWDDYTGKPRVAKNELALGEFYHSQKNFHKAITHYQKSLDVWREIENKAGVCTALFFLGKAYQEAKMRDKALDSYNECLNVLNEIGRKINLPEVQSALSSLI